MPLAVSQPAEQPQAQQAKLQIEAPEGFEDLEGPVKTLFDVYYLDKRIGLFEGTLEDGIFRFSYPGEVAAALPEVQRLETEDFLSGDLDANEALRCLPGDQSDCGSLPVGASGVIVNPETFKVEIFLGRELLSSVPPREILLGEPVAGPSLIQNIAGSVSASSRATEDVRFGLSLDTFASVGRTSGVSRLYGDDTQGLRWQEAYLQHYFSKARMAGGLIREDGSLNLDSTSFYGAELTSFDGRPAASAEAPATPLDIVLPRSARVEIYRSGTLVSARQYAAGLQVLDTSDLPVGSYPVRIVARDSSGVILDETRSFSKTPDLPPPGETVYSVRAGVRAVESFAIPGGDAGESDLLPKSTGESLFSASAGRRLSESTAGRVGVTVVDGELYPEAELQLYKGELRASTAVALGPDSQYSAVANVNFQVGSVMSSISARKTEARPIPDGQIYNPEVYRPFFQSESTVFGTVSTQAWGGALGVRASYSESDLADERNTIGVNYTRPFRSRRFGTGIIGFDAVSTDRETRFGIKLTFRRSAGRNSSLRGAVGVDYSRYEGDGVDDEYVDPLLRVGYTRTGRYKDIALTGDVDAGTSDGESNLILSGAAASRRGDFDIATGVTKSRDDEEAEAFLTSNLQTGFIFGGGKLQFGASGFGDAAVLVDVPTEEGAEDAEGRFRVTVDNQNGGSIRAGQATTVLVPALTNANVGLIPEDAPPFDIDLTPRQVTLYPGNVARMTWEAAYIVSVFGRLVDADGNGIANAVVQTGNDLAVTSEKGYFSVSGRAGENLTARTKDGRNCGVLTVLEASGKDENFVRLGDLICEVDLGDTQVSALAPDENAPQDTGGSERREVALAAKSRKSDTGQTGEAALQDPRTHLPYEQPEPSLDEVTVTALPLEGLDAIAADFDFSALEGGLHIAETVRPAPGLEPDFAPADLITQAPEPGDNPSPYLRSDIDFTAYRRRLEAGSVHQDLLSRVVLILPGDRRRADVETSVTGASGRPASPYRVEPIRVMEPQTAAPAAISDRRISGWNSAPMRVTASAPYAPGFLFVVGDEAHDAMV